LTSARTSARTARPLQLARADALAFTVGATAVVAFATVGDVALTVPVCVVPVPRVPVVVEDWLITVTATANKSTANMTVPVCDRAIVRFK